MKVETRSWPVLVHQLLAMTMQFGGISAERAWPMLARVPDFRDISKDEYLALVEHMKREGYLFEAGGLLSMGPKAEKVFGKKNFLELYAVFLYPPALQGPNRIQARPWQSRASFRRSPGRRDEHLPARRPRLARRYREP